MKKEKIIGLGIIGITLGVITLIGGYNEKTKQELTIEQETQETQKVVNIIELPMEITIRNEEMEIKKENRNIKIEMWTEDEEYGIGTSQKVFIKNLSDYEINLKFIYKLKNNDESQLIVYTHLEPNGISNLMNNIMYDEENIYPFNNNDDYDGYGIDYLDGYSYDGGLTVYSSGYLKSLPYELKDINVSFLSGIDLIDTMIYDARHDELTDKYELFQDSFQYIPDTDNVFGHDIITNFNNVKITQYYK